MERVFQTEILFKLQHFRVFSFLAYKCQNEKKIDHAYFTLN